MHEKTSMLKLKTGILKKQKRTSKIYGTKHLAKSMLKAMIQRILPNFTLQCTTVSFTQDFIATLTVNTEVLLMIQQFMLLKDLIIMTIFPIGIYLSLIHI